MSFISLKKATATGKCAAGLLIGSAAMCFSAADAQTLTSNSTGTHNGFYYSFWKDSGDASFDLLEGGRYASQWNNGTNNWVGGKGWNPGGPRVVNYSGSYNVDNSQNSYLALYGWTRSPLIEYYVIESYGSYNPSSCTQGRQTYGTFESDGATYSIVRCQRVQQPSIDGTQTFYQYFSVREPKKGFGNITGTITVANHFAAWERAGLPLGTHDYMVLATEGYQSQGSSDITVSEGAGGGNAGGNAGGGNPGGGNADGGTTGGGNAGGGTTGGGNAGGGNTGGGNTGGGAASSTDIVVRARGAVGGEHINLIIGDTIVADWNLTTTNADYIYSGDVAGDVEVEFDNDGGDLDVILDYVFVNGETRQAEEMEYNTATYDGECGGGSYSETMHCGGVIGFGDSGDCFSGTCNGSNPGGSTDGGNTGGNAGDNTGGGNTGGNTDGNAGGNTGGGNAGGNNGGNNGGNTGGNAGGNTACSGYVGITFDDGPNANTSALIGLLQQNNLTPVTWFNQGQNIANNAALVSQQLSVGEVQNHSFTHPHMTSYSYQQVYDELNQTTQAIQSAGAPAPTLYRPPYGETNATIQQAAQDLGLRVVTWDVDSRDWDGASAAEIANAANQLQNGQIILMHDGDYTNTNVAISQIAANLQSKGLCPGRIDPSTGRAVAPSGSSNGNSGGNGGVDMGGNNGGGAVPPAGNVGVDNGAAAGGNTGGQCQCNWYGTLYPSCDNLASGWGWENSQSCIGNETCNTQGSYGGLVCN